MDTNFGSTAAASAAGTSAAQSYLHQVQTATPTTGNTVAMTDDDKDRTLHLKPAGSLAALTVTVPSNANSRLGQVACISSTQPVAALTINGATLLNGPAALNANEHYSFRKVDTNVWIREI